MPHTKSVQQRFNRALQDLARTFTDLILVVEPFDTRLAAVDQRLAQLAAVAAEARAVLEKRKS